MSQLVTVVTINKNNANGLVRTLDSLAPLRGHPEIGFLFVDGGSSDSSVINAKNFYLANELIIEPDHGIYNAMNKSLRFALGKYLIWINSGDEVVDNGFRSVLSVLPKLESGLIAAAVEKVDEDMGGVIKLDKPSADMLPKGVLPHQGCFFYGDLVRHLGGYDENFKITADRDLMVRMYLSGCPIHIFSDVVARFWLGGSSLNELRFSEHNKIDIKNGLIGRTKYHWRNLRRKNDNMFGPIKRFLIGGG